jgi:hypothetical protein
MSKRQTRRETGAQSHGSARLMRTGRQTARPPKFFCLAVFVCLQKGGALSQSKWFEFIDEKQWDPMKILS